MLMAISDSRVKDNVDRIGTHRIGFGINIFDCKSEFSAANGADHQFGVIADEMEKTAPGAVTLGTGEYKQVNYGLLGISCPRTKPNPVIHAF